MSRSPNLRSMLDIYFSLDRSSGEPLEEAMERVKADSPRAEVDAILAEIVVVLRLNDDDLEAAYESGLLRSYYWPGGDRAYDPPVVDVAPEVPERSARYQSRPSLGLVRGMISGLQAPYSV